MEAKANIHASSCSLARKPPPPASYRVMNIYCKVVAGGAEQEEISKERQRSHFITNRTSIMSDLECGTNTGYNGPITALPLLMCRADLRALIKTLGRNEEHCLCKTHSSHTTHNFLAVYLKMFFLRILLRKSMRVCHSRESFFLSVA